MSLRIGHGLDAHRLAQGRPLRLGCVDIPWERGLAGHSDGDVAVHALIDALLGAAGLGTIGDRFPSGDERWRDASGAELLRDVGVLLTGSGMRVRSAQVVVVCERPRLAPYLGVMEQGIAAALGAGSGVVTVGATSTDGLGMTGRGEGIAASAVVLLERPDGHP